MVARGLVSEREWIRAMMPRFALRITILPAVMATLVLSLILSPLAVAAENAPSRRLEAVDFSALPGNRVQIKLSLSGSMTPPELLSFTIDNPARIAFDLQDTSSAAPKQKDIGVGVVRSVNAVESRGRTRVVLNLDRLVQYETRTEDGAVYITLNSAAAENVAMAGGDSAQGKNHAITKVDFNRGKQGEGRLVITLSDASIPVNVDETAGKIVVDFLGTRLPKELERRMDVVDFATPVVHVDSFTAGSNTRMVVEGHGKFEHLAYQADNLFTLEVKPVTEAEQKAAEKKEFTGEHLSLNFQDIEIRAVLQIIADFTGMNMVTSDAVKGNVTLRLQNVPWDQALDIVLKSKGLAMRQMGNVILVAPAEEIAAREKQEFESQKQVAELAPLYSDLIQINYAKASEIAMLLKAKENSMLSERGNVTVDDRTNSLLIRDTADKLVDIRKLVSKLDIPVRQVLIESRIVIANDDFSRDLGVRAGFSGARQHDGNGLIGVSGSLSGTDGMVSGAPLPVPTPSLNDRLNVSLPVSNPTGKIALAVLNSNYLVDLELSAMQAEGRGEVVSSPRVITSNQNEASIEQGTEIPYTTASSSGATTVEFKKAVLGLKVKPHITPDDRIIMDLTVSKDSVGEVFQNVPSVDTRSVETQVLVDNGETVVLGGIYEQTRSDETDKVPFFGDLPVVGVLFRRSIHVNDNSELLIFVTPKILKDSLVVH
ncbi:MAG: type IV pilus secretin PilQ [Gammaproteobacteria bacterium]|nr:type IV pilus secretin PilQ [Gammaproteobacteria bacterium]